MSEKIYQLILHKGPRPGEIFSLTLPSMILGRDPMSDIVLNDPEISRNHARLTMGEDGYSIQDMGSTNGTFVNGKRLRGEPFPLENGMSIILGSNVTLEYHAGEVEDEGNLLATVLSPADGLPLDDDFEIAPESSTMMAHDPYAPTAMGDDIEHEEDEQETPVDDLSAFDDLPTFDEPAPAVSSYEPALATSATYTPPPATEMPREVGQQEEKGGSKTRTYIMIGVGVGLFLCCCLLGVVILAAYYLESEGLLDQTTAFANGITSLAALAQAAVL